MRTCKVEYCTSTDVQENITLAKFATNRSFRHVTVDARPYTTIIGIMIVHKYKIFKKSNYAYFVYDAAIYNSYELESLSGLHSEVEK